MAEKPQKQRQPTTRKQPPAAAKKPRTAKAKKPAAPSEDMEVHHHPDLHHVPKPWKEYLLEGLMIFIAVMLGFIAENVREAITDHEHVRELTSQLVRDLKSDTAQLNQIHLGDIKIRAANDSLIQLLQSPVELGQQAQLQKLVIESHSLWLFHPTAGAITAIKNELHLKQFSDSEIIGLIAEYEKHVELLHTGQDITLQYQRSLVDPFLLNHFSPAQLTDAFAHKPPTSTPLRNVSPNDLVQLGTNMVLVKINTDELLRDVELVQKDALKLLQYVQQRYQPDEND